MASVLISQILTHPFVFHRGVIHETRVQEYQLVLSPDLKGLHPDKIFPKRMKKIRKGLKAAAWNYDVPILNPSLTRKTCPPLEALPMLPGAHRPCSHGVWRRRREPTPAGSLRTLKKMWSLGFHSLCWKLGESRKCLCLIWRKTAKSCSPMPHVWVTHGPWANQTLVADSPDKFFVCVDVNTCYYNETCNSCSGKSLHL